MQIQLKQTEIEAALKLYLRHQGVSRPVDEISFTAGRRGSGITADINVSDVTTPLDSELSLANDPEVNQEDKYTPPDMEYPPEANDPEESLKGQDLSEGSEPVTEQDSEQTEDGPSSLFG